MCAPVMDCAPGMDSTILTRIKQLLQMNDISPWFTGLASEVLVICVCFHQITLKYTLNKKETIVEKI